jgi:hypothetical protein
MRFRKFISLWALSALMLGQVALSQHSATHINHGFCFEVAASHHDDHDHQEESEKHQCPECVLTKSLQTALYNASFTLSFTSQEEAFLPQQQSLRIAVNRYKANSARAPPSILI